MRLRSVASSSAALALAAILVASGVTSCSSDETAPPDGGPSTPPAEGAQTPVAIPGADWETVDPAAAGFDPAKLEEIAATAEQGKSNCLVVVRDGKIAGEWYFNGTDQHSAQEVFSVTKSITSTLVGIAQADGDLSITDSASTWIDEWRGTPSEAVTVRNLLSNDSGRQWSMAIDYGDLVQAADRTAFAVGLSQEHPPGQVWAYNNSAIQTLEQVLQEATGQEVAAFAEERLFGPLGMADTEMTTDAAGNTSTFFGAKSTCRDMARFGLLTLNEGRWGDEQIVPAEWVEEATGAPSTELNAAYGYLWWLNHEGIVGSPLAASDLSAAADPSTRRGRLVPGAPEDMFWAIGLGNQIVQVDPGSRTVVVRLGSGELRPQPPTFGPAEASTVVTQALVDD